MATINSTIRMNDKASAVLQNVQKSVNGITTQANKLNTAYNKTASKQDAINAKIAKIDLAQKKVAAGTNLTNQGWLKNVATTVRLQMQLTKLQNQKNRLITQSDQLTQEMINYEDQLKKINTLEGSLGNNDTDRWGVVELNQGLELASKLARGIGSAMNFADTLTTNNARLNMVNDGLQTTEQLNNMIYDAAQRSRSSYTDMVASASKLQLLAGDAFQSSAETVAFNELLNKAFTVSGSSQSEKDSANYQLTQALAAGALQGDELRAVRESAPLVYDAIAKYMGVSKGELKELGAEGAITADIIKSAMFSAGEEINEQFDEMPVTFAQAGTMIQNAWGNAMNQVALKMSEAFNSNTAQSMLNGLLIAIQGVANTISWLFDFIVNNWAWISAILLGVGVIIIGTIVPALWVKFAALMANVVAWGLLHWKLVVIAAIIGIVYGVVKALGGSLKTMALILALLALAFVIVTVAIWAMNGALYANPIVLIIMAIIALIVILFMFADVVGGVIGVAIALFLNWYSLIGNIGMGIWEVIKALCSNMMTAFGNSIKNIKAFFYDLLSTSLEVVVGIIKALNKLPFVDIDYSGIQNSATDWANKAQEERDSKDEYQDIGEAFNNGMNTFAYKDLGEAYNQGAAIGSNLKDGVMGAIDGVMGGLTPEESTTNGMEDYLNNGSIPVDVTGGSLDEVDISDEDLQFLKDIANKDYQMNYKQITPNVTIEFGDVRESADVNVIKDTLTKMMAEELSELYVLEEA